MAILSQDPALIKAVAAVYALLRQVQPQPDNSDVAWAGPWYVLPRRRWYATWFLLYRGQLYASVNTGGRSWNELHWKLGSDQVELPPNERGFAPWPNDELLWRDVLGQVQRRLAWGLANPDRYNRHQDRYVPMERRTGHILRRYTWPLGLGPALPAAELNALEQVVLHGQNHPPRPALSVARFLSDAAVAYDAAFEDLRALPPLAKYRRRADSRHGGMLDLPDEDEDAFRQWFRSRSWQGAHPWEIVFGHPHGVHLYPQLDEQTGHWSYALTVSEEGLYPAAARMAVALDAAAIPLTFPSGKRVLAALRGEDEVEVGQSYPAVAIGPLLESRPDALQHIRWDPLPTLQHIAPDQVERLKKAEEAR